MIGTSLADIRFSYSIDFVIFGAWGLPSKIINVTAECGVGTESENDLEGQHEIRHKRSADYF